MCDIRPITIAILLHHVKEPALGAARPVRRAACLQRMHAPGLERPAKYILNNLIKNFASFPGKPPLISQYSRLHYYLKIPVELRGFEPRTPALQRQCSSQLSYSPSVTIVGLGGLEPPTSRLSGVRSNHLSYKPPYQAGLGCRRYSPAAASV